MNFVDLQRGIFCSSWRDLQRNRGAKGRDGSLLSLVSVLLMHAEDVSLICCEVTAPIAHTGALFARPGSLI